MGRADEPRSATEPRVLADSAVDLTQVVDSFDVGNDFDLTVSLAFEHESRSAAILRETSISQSGLTTGGFLSDKLNVAEYTSSKNRLVPELSLGLYKDIALKARLPIILSYTQELKDRDGAEATDSIGAMGLLGEQLFEVPFESPTRSGIEYLAVGLDFGIMNQFRDPTKPTWVFGIEGRFNVSEPMHACNENPKAGQVECADPSDVNRDGSDDAPINPELGQSLEGNFSGTVDPGVSRGTTALEAHTYVSRRVKYIEPYSGVSALIEFPTGSSDFGLTDLQGSLVNHPPLRGSMVLGVSVIPWEVVEKFQRVAFDLRFVGTYVSEGRDYSELFDALGSSDAASLRNPQFADYQANLLDPNDPDSVDPDVPSVVNPNSQKVYFNGLTDVQQHGEYTFSAQFTWQAGEYVKFNLGGAWEIIQAHLITFDQACNPDFAGDVTQSGPCKGRVGTEADGRPIWSSAGIPNPNHRKVINDPGQRFKVGTSNGFNGWIRASVMF